MRPQSSLYNRLFLFHFFAPEVSVLMQCVPPLLKAQVSPQLHSLSLPLWSPVLHVQVGFSGIVGWQKCSSTAPCAQGACWWGIMPLGALLKHMSQLQCCDSCHLMDQHIPRGRPHISLCACNPLLQCPSQWLTVLVSPAGTKLQAGRKLKPLRSQISQLRIFCHFWEKSAVCTNPQAQ